MNISIIGMMGSGKTTVAKDLAQKLRDFSVIDTDAIIAEIENLSINDIFKTKGEKYFRLIETRVLGDILNNDNQIISTGGGIVLKDENIKMLKEKSVVFFLKASDEVLFERIKNDTSRPLLNCSDMKDRITKILNERREKYEKAHHIIDTNNKNIEDIAGEIIRKSGINGNC
ncbi:MAG: shikimate kinase [Candidatus Avigastranaerophilus sp.]